MTDPISPSVAREQRRTRRAVQAIALGLIGLSVAMGHATLAKVESPWVSTDSSEYLAGEPVTITGGGFAPAEALTLQVTHVDGGAEDDRGHEAATVAADADGAFSATWAIAEADTAGSEFVLHVIGNMSGTVTTLFKRVARIQTDKRDYQPGETAAITGWAFEAGESVTLHVVHLTGEVDGGAGHDPFSATADANGRLTASWHVNPDDSRGSTFQLTATGDSSGRTASTTFTDAVGTPPDSTADAVYGQLGDFTTRFFNKKLVDGVYNSSNDANENTLWVPSGVESDRQGNLYIADNGNSRILFYRANTTTAIGVYGQGGSLTARQGNNGGISANSLLFPEGITLDGAGNLYVADRNNNRVLFYPAGSTTAELVYGQNDQLNTNSSNGGTLPPDAGMLFAPYDVVVDNDGNVYIADAGNNRVLFYLSGDRMPSRVYGQHNNYTTGAANNGGLSADTLNTPRGLALDSAGNLYVADWNNSRVLVFEPGNTTAKEVYGQSGFTTRTAGTAADRLGAPEDVALDRNDNLYVSDTGNSRVLFFPKGSKIATHVYGQGGSFTTGTPNKGGISADSLLRPRSVELDRVGNLYVADHDNNRVLKFNRPADTVPPTAAPIQSPAANGAGWNATDVLVLWNWSDDEAGTGVDEDNCTASSTSSGEGDLITLSATCTDFAGNTAEASYTIKVDQSAPTITAAAITAPNAAGWYQSDVTIAFTCEDGLSGVADCPADETLTAEGAAVNSSALVATDVAGNTSAPSNVVTVSIDKTAPTISAVPTTSPNAAGWYNTSVEVAFTCTDGLSSVSSCPVSQTLSSEGVAVTSSSETVTDVAGNLSAPSNVVTVGIDKTSPSVALIGGPANGASYNIGSVPAAPTCTASDTLSGPAGGCAISGYSTSVGTHTLTGSAADYAGNHGTVSVTYTVLPSTSTMIGFYQPVDMGGIWNSVKAGATVPLKFEVFTESTELTDPSSVLQPLSATQSPCSGGPFDEIELVATGGTSLRYDVTEGRFIYNWQTPKKPGYCYVVTVTTADGVTLTANFRLK